ncbi:hypothetical protein [Zunongwangia sp. H14]|uniref:hypothetical protein n=1 Tax=Zunongwangia sp. H14 TaxID=3240792 RepID=UPI0035617D81
MKIIKLFTVILAFFMVSTGFAQEKKNQAFLIHEDQVNPSMLKEYEQVSKDFVKACQQYKPEGIDWSTASMDNGRYLSISPIEKLSDIEEMSYAPLIEKMGEDEFRAMLDRFNKCYDKHGSYVVVLNEPLSYMPDGLDPETPGENYRKWHKMEVSASNVPQLREKMIALKDLFERKGSKMYYRIYHNGFGNIGDYYVAVISAKDAIDYAKKSAENQKLLGEEGEKAFEEMMQYVSSYEVTSGEMRPDLSYQAPKTTTITEVKQ